MGQRGQVSRKAEQIGMRDGQEALEKRIAAHAHGLGFDLMAITPVALPAHVDRYHDWLDKGHHGGMAYLAHPEALARRADPKRILPGVRSVLAVAVNYHTRPLPPELRDDPERGVVASYAWGDDYHDLLMPRLDQLAAFIEAEMGEAFAYRSYVDTGPILERDLAARAGLGFVGKNTNLIHPCLGSWLFLGELLLAVELPPIVSERRILNGPCAGEVVGVSGFRSAEPRSVLALRIRGTAHHGRAAGTCAGCTRCLDACPTNALAAPYVLDARRCLSYLTIELKGPIPRDLRPLLGNRVFGCDICQEVCPWNRRFARPTSESGFQPRPGAIAPRLLDLMTLDDEGFRRRFQGSPVKRAKRRGLLRNVAVALGNGGDPAAIPALVAALHEPEPLIRGHAAWALGRFGRGEVRRTLEAALSVEEEEWVRGEIVRAL
jgi:epoxyqueuosine reductase